MVSIVVTDLYIMLVLKSFVDHKFPLREVSIYLASIYLPKCAYSDTRQATLTSHTTRSSSI